MHGEAIKIKMMPRRVAAFMWMVFTQKYRRFQKSCQRDNALEIL